MQELDPLGRYLLEHRLQGQRRHLQSVRNDRRTPRGIRRSARLLAQEIRASRRHGR